MAAKYPQLKGAFDSLNDKYVEAEAKIIKFQSQLVSSQTNAHGPVTTHKLRKDSKDAVKSWQKHRSTRDYEAGIAKNRHKSKSALYCKVS